MIIKPVSRLVQELDARSITVLGVTCHGGIGLEGLHHLRSGLTGAEGDIIAVAGDVSPLGRDPYYHAMAGFIDAYSADRPVHVLRGNHDGPDFEECFGWADRAIFSEAFALIMLDNSGRRFSGETLDFLRETMAIVDSPNVIVAFHVPPPNRISGNTMSRAEWQRFEDALGVWRKRVTLLLCGHEHCYYEDDVNGLHLIVAGGGARMSPVERAVLLEPYALEISFDDSGNTVVHTRTFGPALPDAHSPDVHAELLRAYDAECRTLVALRLYADDARAAGMDGLAHGCRAACEAGLSRARMIRRLLAGGEFSGEAAAALLREWTAAENAPADEFPAGDAGNLLARRILASVAATRRNTALLLDAFLADHDSPAQAAGYHVCTSCSMLFAGGEAPNYCSSCGAPYQAIREVK